MAIREVREMGDDVLEKQCKPVTKMTLRTKILIEDMLDTMYRRGGGSCSHAGWYSQTDCSD